MWISPEGYVIISFSCLLRFNNSVRVIVAQFVVSATKTLLVLLFVIRFFPELILAIHLITYSKSLSLWACLTDLE